MNDGTDIDGQVIITEWQSTFTLDGTRPSTTVSLQPKLKNVISMWISAYTIRGVPIIAGIPVESTYFLDVQGLPMHQRCSAQDDPVGNAFPLLLKGAFTRVELERLQSITAEDAGTCTQLTFRLLKADGSPAVYDSCVLHLTFRAKSQPTSVARVIASNPSTTHNLTFRAKPYVR